MPNPYFKFKRFTVYHDKCAMKVGTDGVLLGLWADTSDANRILDIGTGTGLISLILAQRCTNLVSIDAIDIDRDAILQAKDNVQNAPFDTIVCHHTSLQDYVGATNVRYDLIVSNPPYFSLSLHSPDKKRTLARHTDSLDMKDLIRCSAQLLSDNGRFCLIYPHSEKELLIEIAEGLGLFTTKVTNVYPTPDSLPKRVLLEFSVVRNELVESDFTIEKERHVYSPEFVNLAKDFYLKL